MIIESFVPNDRDGLFYNIRKVAGPFTNEMQARRVAKAWSGSEDSDDIEIEEFSSSRRKINTKKYEPEFVEPKKKIKKVTVEDEISKNVTSITELPQPPKSSVQFNVDKPYNPTHTESKAENGITHLESAFELNDNISEELADNNENGILEQNTNDGLVNFLTTDDFLDESFITIENNITEIPNPPDSENSNRVEMKVCCCEKIDVLKALIEKRSKKDSQIMTQLMLLNGSNTRITAALHRLDEKVQKIMTADNRLRALATPAPLLPSPFIEFLPVKCEEDVLIVEELLTPTAENNALQYKEELKTYLNIKYGNLHLSAAIRGSIDACFYKNVLCHYSYRGKTKKKFIDLKLYAVIREALSGLLKTSSDEKTFHNVVDNYLRHAKQ